jgi:hypothetical protein
MFLYKAASRLGGRQGDLDPRTTLKALKRFGLPPENLCPYEPDNVGTEANCYCFSFSEAWQDLRFLRLDIADDTPGSTLETVRSYLAAGFACTIGFAVYSSLTSSADIPFPTGFDSVRGGQVVLAVGYDDDRRIRSEKGAILVRNSWGKNWGDSGYGWLPYAYIRRSLAADFWTLLKPEWLSSGELSRPSPISG